MSNAVDGTDVDILWNGGWECERVCGRTMALTVKMEAVILIGKSTGNRVCFVC